MLNKTAQQKNYYDRLSRLCRALNPCSIAFNHQNQWHFKSLNHPYRLAFEHLTFDKHGFPPERPK